MLWMPGIAGSTPVARRGFFRYETSVMSHQFESKSTACFFILKSWRVLRIVRGFNRISPVNVGRHLPVPSRENDATRLCLSLI